MVNKINISRLPWLCDCGFWWFADKKKDPRVCASEECHRVTIHKMTKEDVEKLLEELKKK